MAIPEDIDYSRSCVVFPVQRELNFFIFFFLLSFFAFSFTWMSGEAREKLEAVRPPTLGAASRVDGVTPALLVSLMQHIRRAQATA